MLGKIPRNVFDSWHSFTSVFLKQEDVTDWLFFSLRFNWMQMHKKGKCFYFLNKKHILMFWDYNAFTIYNSIYCYSIFSIVYL